MFPTCVQRTGRSVSLCIQAASRAAGGATAPRPLAPNAQKRRPGPTGRPRRRSVRPGGVGWPSAQRGTPRGRFGHSRAGRNHEKPSVGRVSTSEECSPTDPCRREVVLSVLSVTFKGISKVFGMHVHLRAALKEAPHSPHMSSVYSSPRGGQTQFGFAEEDYAGVVVRK